MTSIYHDEIIEVERLIALTSFTNIKLTLQQHLKKLKKLEHDEQQQQQQSSSSPAEELVNTSLPSSLPSSSSTTTTTPIVTITNNNVVNKSITSYIPIESYSWDQGEYNTPTVSIFIDLEDVGKVKDQVSISFTKSSFDVKVHNLNNKNYRLVKDNLDKDIIPDKSKYIIKNNKIVLKLQKVKGEYSYDTWSSLISKKKKSEKEEEKKKDPMGGEWYLL
jgi:calcyclin binding protein